MTAPRCGDCARYTSAKQAVRPIRSTSTVFLVVHGEARYDAPLTGRVADSTVIRHDLTQPGAPKSEADSLSAVARALLTEMVRK
jgi:hypothetical protein